MGIIPYVAVAMLAMSRGVHGFAGNHIAYHDRRCPSAPQRRSSHEVSTSTLIIHRLHNIQIFRHNIYSSKRCMAPTALDDETTKTPKPKTQVTSTSVGNAPTRKRRIDNPMKRYFNINSSVRSTTQTDAIGEKQPAVDDVEEETSIPPDVLRPFSLLLLSQFILFIGVGAVIPTIPLYGQSIGLSSTSNGVVIAAPAVALLLISRTAGEKADRGRKVAMMGGMGLIAVSDIGTAFSNSLVTLVLARLGLGVGRGYAEAGERGMLTDLANQTPRLRGRALALQQACVALGIAIGAPLGGRVVEEFGARSSFLCVSAAAFIALTLYSILPETLAVEDTGENTIASNSDSTKNDDEADWLQLLKTSSTWRSLAVAQSGASFGFACKIAVIPLLANEYLGGATGAGLLISAAGLAGLVGAPLGGFITDKAGSRFAAAIAGSISGVALAFVPIGLSLKDTEILSSLGNESPLLVEGLTSLEATAFTILVLLWSIGVSAQGPALTALAQENAPSGSEATALGLPRAVGDGTYIVAPLVLGYFSDQLGDAIPGISCTIAGGAICLGSIALFLSSTAEGDGVKI